MYSVIEEDYILQSFSFKEVVYVDIIQSFIFGFSEARETVSTFGNILAQAILFFPCVCCNNEEK